MSNEWTPFEEVTESVFPRATVDLIKNRYGLTTDEEVANWLSKEAGTPYMNNRYMVHVRHCTPLVPEFPPLIHLSIKRLDKEAVHDWRDFQRIKNEIVGPEAEGVELYPAESRLVDTANQYHIWCLPPGHVFPFGFDEGRVVSEETGDGITSTHKQRPIK